MRSCQTVLIISFIFLFVQISFAFRFFYLPQHIQWSSGKASDYSPLGMAMNGGATFTGRRAFVPLGRPSDFGKPFELAPMPGFRAPGIGSAIAKFGPNAYKTSNSMISPMRFGRGGFRSSGPEFASTPNFGSMALGAARPLAQE